MNNSQDEIVKFINSMKTTIDEINILYDDHYDVIDENMNEVFKAPYNYYFDEIDRKYLKFKKLIDCLNDAYSIYLLKRLTIYYDFLTDMIEKLEKLIFKHDIERTCGLSISL